MPAAANIVINDGAATPVAHTLVPMGKDERDVFWFEQSIPVPLNSLGALRAGISLKRPQNGKRLDGKAIAVITLAKPTLETLGTNAAGITPPPTLAYEEKARISFELPERSSKQERKDTRVLFQNLLGNANVIALIDDLLSTY